MLMHCQYGCFFYVARDILSTFSCRPKQDNIALSFQDEEGRPRVVKPGIHYIFRFITHGFVPFRSFNF